LPRSNGKVDLVRTSEFLGNLDSGVASADHKDGPFSNVPRCPVGAAVELKDARVEAIGDRGNAWHLKCPVATTTLSAASVPASVSAR
jgi:hypothetical protein